MKLFEAGSIDWAGSPLSVLPQDAIASLKEKGILQISPGAGTHWFRLNTDKAPFDDIKIRQAFSMTLDRESIVDHITQGGQTPAYGVIPPSFGVHHEKKDVGEFKADIGKLPPIVLSYAANDRNHKIAQAVQQQWSQALGVKIILEASEVACLVQKISKGAYQIALGSWYADIRDPINFLEIFKEKSNPTNQTFWHNDAYTKLLDESSVELDPVRRQHLLDKAEAILIDETPVAPLFHSSYNYLKKDTVNGVYFSPLGFLDFKEASEQQ